MTGKRQSRTTAGPAAPPEPATYRAKVALSNSRTGKEYAPGDTLTVEDFDHETLEHWAAIGRVVRVNG